MTDDRIYYGISEWEYTSWSNPCIFERGTPTYNNKFIYPLHKKDSVEIPISITGNIRSTLPMNNIAYGLTTMSFDKNCSVYKYLKNYKKLIETFFIHTAKFSYYSTEQFSEKYFIGRGILTDDKGNILCLFTRNYTKRKISEDKDTYVCGFNIESLTIYISPQLITSPKNAFEKAFVKYIYNSALTWNLLRIIIDSNINKLFLLDKMNIRNREELQLKLNKIAEFSERIIDSIEDYDIIDSIEDYEY